MRRPRQKSLTFVSSASGAWRTAWSRLNPMEERMGSKRQCHFCGNEQRRTDRRRFKSIETGIGKIAPPRHFGKRMEPIRPIRDRAASVNWQLRLALPVTGISRRRAMTNLLPWTRECWEFSLPKVAPFPFGRRAPATSPRLHMEQRTGVRSVSRACSRPAGDLSPVGQSC